MSFGLALVAFGATWAPARSRVGLVKTRILCFRWTVPLLGLAGVMTALVKLAVCAFRVVQYHQLEDQHHLHRGDLWNRLERQPRGADHRVP
jgi:hypothetical protein